MFQNNAFCEDNSVFGTQPAAAGPGVSYLTFAMGQQ